LVLGGATADAQRIGESRSSLPGIDRVAHADQFDRIAAASLAVGYGYLGAVIEDNDAHHRALGSVAVSFRPWKFLAIGVRYDNRYDKHVDLTSGSDDGWLADSRLSVRYAHLVSPKLSFGVEGTLWFPPGGSPPSTAFSATSVESVLIGTWSPIPAFALSANTGFRLDNSADSVDNADMLSQSDRLALGVSDFNAVLAGVGASFRTGPVDLLGEVSLDLLVGSDAPDLSESPLRIVGGVRWRATEDIQVQFLAEMSPSKIDQIAAMGPLVPVEPSFTTTVAVSYAHDLAKGGSSKREEIKQCWDGTKVKASQECPPEFGQFEVTVVDEAGNPVDKATVQVKAGDNTVGPSGVNESGVLVVDELRSKEKNAATKSFEPVSAEITAAAEGYDSKSTTRVVTAGKTVSVKITLTEALPPGQLRGRIQSFRGKAVAAQVRINPGDRTITADANGKFEIDLAPGDYEVTITADGFQEQTKTVKIDVNDVLNLNIDLRAAP
jgi:hypothetical protein